MSETELEKNQAREIKDLRELYATAQSHLRFLKDEIARLNAEHAKCSQNQKQANADKYYKSTLS